jgi:hypothetical protein
MSETDRSYTGTHPVRPRGLGKKRRYGRIVFGILVPALIGYGYWTTRDNYPLHGFIPADQAYQVFAKDLVAQRGRLAESKVWQALPSPLGMSEIPKLLRANFGMPEWVLNNLAPNVCCVSGKDLTRFRDALFVSRMTRIGCFLQKFSRWAPGIERDPAGGLRLWQARDAAIYFAVRGRLLLISPSRDALIRALTLRPQDAASAENFARYGAGTGAEDLTGIIAPSPNDPLGRVFQSMGFALRVGATEVRLKCRGDLRAGRESLAGIVSPQELAAPPDGMLTLSLNLGRPLNEVWKAAVETLGKGEQVEKLWKEWSTSAEGAVAPPIQFATALLGALGPGIRLNWCGVDLNEMVPMPEIVATIDADPEAVTKIFASLPPLSDGPERYSLRPQYDAQVRRVYLPLIGGPAMTPTAGLFGKSLLISSSQTRAEAVLSGAASETKLAQPGNAYLCIKPHACLDAARSIAALLAENQLLKGYTPETLQTFAKPWLDSASVVQQITALAACDKGELTVEVTVAFTRDSAAPPA